jgi:hypothetical protein
MRHLVLFELHQSNAVLGQQRPRPVASTSRMLPDIPDDSPGRSEALRGHRAKARDLDGWRVWYPASPRSAAPRCPRWRPGMRPYVPGGPLSCRPFHKVRPLTRTDLKSSIIATPGTSQRRISRG